MANVTRSIIELCGAVLLLRLILVIMQFLDNFPVITRAAMLTKQALNKHLSKEQLFLFVLFSTLFKVYSGNLRQF